jgi:integrase
LTTDFIQAYDLHEAFGLERGTISCASCRRKVVPAAKKLEAVTCQHCGHPHVYLRLKYEGSRIYIRTDKHGRAHTFATAAKALIDINQEIADHVFNPREWAAATVVRRLFENEIEAWIERREIDAEKGKLAPSTLGNYRTYAAKYYRASSQLTGRDVREIRLKHLQLFYDELTGSAKYRKNIMDGLYTFFNWLKRWGEIAEVPTWPELETVIEPERFSLTREEQDAVLPRIPAEHRDVIEFMMETGLRPAEACALMLVDVDAGRRRILVRRTYSESELRNRTKQKKEFWRILSDRAWELVQSNMRSDFAFVFRNPATGRGYRYKFLYRLWVAYSGLSVGLYEGTRHSYCTQLSESDEGLSPKHLQQLMGHADLRSTMKYVHPSDEKLRAAVNRRGKPRKLIRIEEGKKS